MGSGLPRGDKVGTNFVDLALDHVARVRVQLAQDDRGAFLDDAGFLLGDLGETVAQFEHVIEGNAGDGHHLGLGHHVGRIQSTPEASLDDRQFDLCLLKRQKGRDRRNFEKGQLGPFIQYALQQVGQLRVFDRLSVDPDAL